MLGVLDDGLLEILDGARGLSDELVDHADAEVRFGVVGVFFAELLENVERLIKMALLGQNLSFEAEDLFVVRGNIKRLLNELQGALKLIHAIKHLVDVLEDLQVTGPVFQNLSIRPIPLRNKYRPSSDWPCHWRGCRRSPS